MHRCYHSLSHTKDDLNTHSITLALMKTCLAEDITWSSYKKKNIFIAFYHFFFRGFRFISFSFHSPHSFQFVYSHCMLHVVFVHNDSVEKNTKLGISTYKIVVQEILAVTIAYLFILQNFSTSQQIYVLDKSHLIAFLCLRKINLQKTHLS